MAQQQRFDRSGVTQLPERRGALATNIGVRMLERLDERFHGTSVADSSQDDGGPVGHRAALQLGDQSLGACRGQTPQELLGPLGNGLAVVGQGAEQLLHHLGGHVGALLGPHERV